MRAARRAERRVVVVDRLTARTYVLFNDATALVAKLAVGSERRTAVAAERNALSVADGSLRRPVDRRTCGSVVGQREPFFAHYLFIESGGRDLLIDRKSVV